MKIGDILDYRQPFIEFRHTEHDHYERAHAWTPFAELSATNEESINVISDLREANWVDVEFGEGTIIVAANYDAARVLLQIRLTPGILREALERAMSPLEGE